MERYVERVVSHPLYTGGMQDYDFMILKLTESALKDANGQDTGAAIVKLNRDATVPKVGDALTGMGYGKTDENADGTSPDFREVEIYYVSDDTCREQYGQSDFLASVMFCAGVPGGGKDTCQVSQSIEKKRVVDICCVGGKDLKTHLLYLFPIE